MQAHFVVAHPESRSFNGHLVQSGATALQAEGWNVTISDLYAMGFDPCERPEHYASRANSERFEAQTEQRHASNNGTLPDMIAREIELLDRADLLILQYPMWWHMPPAILKGWFDRVLVHGEVYTSDKRFERGRFAGKRAMLSVTVGTSRNTYAHDGRSGDIDLLLWPVHFSLAFASFTVIQPLVTYDVEAGIRYSDPEQVKARLEGSVSEFCTMLPQAFARPIVPFNRMEQWGEDGRIVPGAPVYSPFIRRKQNLKLE